jgi:hypothetical protein
MLKSYRILPIYQVFFRVFAYILWATTVAALPAAASIF